MEQCYVAFMCYSCRRPLYTYLLELVFFLTCLLAFLFNSLLATWLDYQEAFDSVPHKWLIKALELAKVPEKIITVIKALMKK